MYLLAFVEHDWIDAVNASSTVVIALFTVAMFFVVKYQLRTSKDIERAWVMVRLARDPFSSLFLCENTTQEGTNKVVETAAFLQLTFKNDGNGPVWVKHLQSRLVLLDSLEQLPRRPEFTEKDNQHWYPPPFVETESVRLQLIAGGSQAAKDCLVVYGKIVYLDKFREERFSTFGCLINAGGEVERMKSHPEYNRNT